MDSQYTPEEWQTLQLAPFWAFSGLVGAYRNIDPLEYEAFWQCVEVAGAAPGRLNQAVIASITADRERLVALYESDSRTIARGLCAVAQILAKAPADEAERFKDMLIIGVCTGVARARGRFGRIVSEDDEKTIELVAQFLA
jgi:hypothetical protein